MNPYTYTNGAGQTFPMYERPLEPRDCWQEKPTDTNNDN